MDRRTCLTALALLPFATVASGAERAADFTFRSIDGGTIELADFSGRPVLVVNTASRCAYTNQYDGLQALYDRFRDRGLVVLAVPSPSFRQELGSAEAVKDFCEVNFALDLPMTDLVEVTGPGAHPFYRWAAAQGVVPRWNFHKILLDGTGAIAAEFHTSTEPQAPPLLRTVEALLAA